MTWWPGWNSIEGAAKWGDIFFWTGFALLGLLAGCEILSKVYSWRKDTLIAVRDDLIAVAQDARSQQADQSPPRRRPTVTSISRPPAFRRARAKGQSRFRNRNCNRKYSRRRHKPPLKRSQLPARPNRSPASPNGLPAA